MTYYVYILCSKRNGTLYVGVTNDINRRLYEHSNKLAEGFPAKYDVDKLVYAGAYEDVTTAIHREKCLKRWKRAWKLKLIEEVNPDWKDLSDGLI